MPHLAFCVCLVQQLLELLSSLEDAPAQASAAAQPGAAVPEGGPLGLRVDRGIARRAAEQHVRTVRPPARRSCFASR